MVSTKLMTAQDLWNLGDRGDNCELIRGELVELVPPGTVHGRTMTNLAVLLGSFVKAHQLGRVYAGDVGFVLQRNPDTVLGPDLAFLTADRIPGDDTAYSDEAPDLAVEIVSPGNSRSEIDRKLSIYLGAGVRSAWIVYPNRCQVIVLSPDRAPQIFENGTTLTGGEILPG